MPADNVEPCPHCLGTGEVRVQWLVEYRYQDCSETFNCSDEQSARHHAAEDIKSGVERRCGCTISVRKQVLNVRHQ